MKSSWFAESQIVSILNEAEAGRQGPEACRKHSIGIQNQQVAIRNPLERQNGARAGL
ncbi:hypothetical protein ACFL00_01475 [Pseudomonadota bacterium]